MQHQQFWWRDGGLMPNDRDDRKYFLVLIWNPDAQAKLEDILQWFKTWPPGRGFRKRTERDSIIYQYRIPPLDPVYNSAEICFNSGAVWWEYPKIYPGTLRRELLICDDKGNIDVGYFDAEANELRVRSPDGDPNWGTPAFWSEKVPHDNSSPRR